MTPLEAVLNLVVRDLAKAQVEPSAVIVAISTAKHNMRFIIYLNSHRVRNVRLTEAVDLVRKNSFSPLVARGSFSVR